LANNNQFIRSPNWNITAQHSQPCPKSVCRCHPPNVLPLELGSIN